MNCLAGKTRHACVVPAEFDAASGWHVPCSRADQSSKVSSPRSESGGDNLPEDPTYAPGGGPASLAPRFRSPLGGARQSTFGLLEALALWPVALALRPS